MTDTGDVDFMKTIVVKAHHATDSSQLNLKLKDIVYVLEKDDSGWWGGHKEGEDCTGWFPGSCVLEIIEDDAAESRAEPMASRQQSVAASVASAEVAQSSESKGADVFAQNPLELHGAMNHGGSLVASPSRRTSACATPADSSAYISLQAEYKTLTAIADDRAREINQLQGRLTELEASRKVESISSKREIEDLRSKCRADESHSSEMKKVVQELTAKMDRQDADRRHLEAEIRQLQAELAKSRQEVKCLRDKDAASQALLAEQKAMHQAPAPPQTASTGLSESAATDTARCLFPTSDEGRVDTLPLFGGASAGISSTAPICLTDTTSVKYIDEKRPKDAAAVKYIDEKSTCAVKSAPLPSSFSQQSGSLRSDNRATPTCPRPASSMFRSNSATRPAFSPSAMSPGSLAKCRSTGDLPSTPRRIDDEMPVIGSVKDKIGLFESATAKRSATPKRSSLEGCNGGTTPPAVRSFQKSPSWRENTQSTSACTRPANGSQNHFARHSPLNLPEKEDAVDEQVNFNMSPMRRLA